MKKILFFTSTLLILQIPAFLTAGIMPQDKSVSCYSRYGTTFKTVSYSEFVPVTLQGEQLDIEIQVVQNFWEKDNAKEDLTLVLIPDMAHTSASLIKMATSFTRDNKLSAKNLQIYILNMAGQRNSDYPKTYSYSNLSLDDYISTVQQLLDSIYSLQTINMILARGQGGLLIQLLQDSLVKEGSSLYSRFGIENTLLLSSYLPGNIEWQAADEGLLFQLSTLFSKSHKTLGPVLDIDPQNWQSIFFSDQMGKISPDAPSVNRITRGSLITYEPQKVITEVLGFNGNIRRQVDYGIFDIDYGTKLSVISLKNGKTSTAAEQQKLYLELTGDSEQTNFNIITASRLYQDYTSINSTSVLKIVKNLLNPAAGYTEDEGNALRGLASNPGQRLDR